MAHYDCSNCGGAMGIAWGICDKCTPKEYLELKEKQSKLIDKAYFAFQDYMNGKRSDWINSYLEKTDYNKISEDMKEIENKYKRS